MIVAPASNDTSAPSSSAVTGSDSAVAAGEKAVTGALTTQAQGAVAEDATVPMEVEDDSVTQDVIQVVTDTSDLSLQHVIWNHSHIVLNSSTLTCRTY